MRDHTKEVIYDVQKADTTSTMERPQSYSTWLWIPGFWLVLYPSVTIMGFMLAILAGNASYWLVFLIGVPLLVAPVTYRNLVGGACSLRFRVCGLVRGILAGLILVLLSFLADTMVRSVVGPIIGWNPLPYDQLGLTPYYSWFIGALIGGFAARVAEVRNARKPVGALKVSEFR